MTSLRSRRGDRASTRLSNNLRALGVTILGSVLVSSLSVLVGCSTPEAAVPSGASPVDPDDGRAFPIVVVTFASLRLDLLEAFGEAEIEAAGAGSDVAWTPTLDALYAGFEGARGYRGITASSSPLPSFASLVFGVDPWLHGLPSHVDAERRADLPSVFEALGALGYRSTVFVPLRQQLQRFGLFGGVDALYDLGDGSEALAALAALEERQLLWIHVPVSDPPFLDHRRLVPRLADRPAGPAEIDGAELLAFADPARPLPDDLARAARELYRQEAAWGDQFLGRILGAIGESGRVDETLLAVTALVGCEFGEHDQVLFAQNLGRESIEVPLVVRLPDELSGALAPGASGGSGEAFPWVSSTRLFSTLVEAAGGRGAPVHSPSLFQSTGPAIFSSLFMQGPENHFALVEPTADGGARQLVWSARFADPEPEYFRAQVVEAGGADPSLDESPRRLRERLLRAFRATPPLAGVGRPTLRLERWNAGGGVEALDDPAAAEALAAALGRRFARFADADSTRASQVARWRHARSLAEPETDLSAPSP